LNNIKKLLFVIPALTGGGAERVLLTIINNLDIEKYEITLVLFNKEGDLIKNLKNNIKIIIYQKRNKYSLVKLILQLRNTIKSFNKVTVISFLHYTNIISVISCLCLKKKPKLILCEHSNHRKYLPESKLWYFRKLFMKYTYKKADQIVAISREMRENLIIDFKLNPHKVNVIYNPIPIEEISQLAKDKSNIFSLKSDKKRKIIAAGRLARVKRFDRLIRSFAIVRKELDVSLLIMGQGELLNELKELTNRLNINEDVIFLGFQKNPYAWISIADIFVLSSDYEGFPMVILESMACGTPVISSDCSTGPREIISNGENGILVPVEDENILANAILSVLKDNNLKKKFSREGKIRVDDFKIDKIIPQYELLF
jgi:glycosyltransferase involved in cell wall biosynthesis